MLGVVLALIIAGSFFILGFSGLRAALGIIILFFVPFYLIFSNFDLSQQEKIIFSFFAGISLYPSLVYWLGFLLPLRISILAVFIILSLSAYLISRLCKRSSSSN